MTFEYASPSLKNDDDREQRWRLRRWRRRRRRRRGRQRRWWRARRRRRELAAKFDRDFIGRLPVDRTDDTN